MRHLPVGVTGTVLVLTLLLSACSASVRGHGYAPKPEELGQIAIGQDSIETVQQKIGRPGLAGLVEGNTWFYVASTVEKYAYREPRVIDRQVVMVKFNAAGTVEDVRSYGIEDGRVIDLVTRTTPTYGKELTVVQQLFGNFLNFSAGSLLN